MQRVFRACRSPIDAPAFLTIIKACLNPSSHYCDIRITGTDVSLSGGVFLVAPDRVRPAGVSLAAAMGSLRRCGTGAGAAGRTRSGRVNLVGLLMKRFIFRFGRPNRSAVGARRETGMRIRWVRRQLLIKGLSSEVATSSRAGLAPREATQHPVAHS